MPGLDPGIHQSSKSFAKGWITGSSPAMSPPFTTTTPPLQSTTAENGFFTDVE
jgi:hypothetical protein